MKFKLHPLIDFVRLSALLIMMMDDNNDEWLSAKTIVIINKQEGYKKGNN